jgi:hypothetical protein
MEWPFSEHVGIRWNKTASGSVSSLGHRVKPRTKPGKQTRSSVSTTSRIKASGGRGMAISHTLMILCSVFTVFGSTLAFANPMMVSEDSCPSYQKKATACHVPISKSGAATGCARCRLPNAPNDDWPAGMLLGDAGLVLALQHRLDT